MEKKKTGPEVLTIKVLRFTSKEEVDYLLKAVPSRVDKKERRESIRINLLKVLNEISVSFLRIVDDAGVDIETGKYVGDYQKEPADPKKEYIDKIHGKEKTT
mgnify:CR=1 FL=1